MNNELNEQLDRLIRDRDSLNETDPAFYDDYDLLTDQINQCEFDIRESLVETELCTAMCIDPADLY